MVLGARSFGEKAEQTLAPLLVPGPASGEPIWKHLYCPSANPWVYCPSANPWVCCTFLLKYIKPRVTRIAVIKATACHRGCWLAKIFLLLLALVHVPPPLESHTLDGTPLSLCYMVSLEIIIFIPRINHTSLLNCNHIESKDSAFL